MSVSRRSAARARRSCICQRLFLFLGRFPPGAGRRRPARRAGDAVAAGRPDHPMQVCDARAVSDLPSTPASACSSTTAATWHAKVAASTTTGPTVGSSNIDAFSPLLAREANVLSDDRGFAGGTARQPELALCAGAREPRRSGHSGLAAAASRAELVSPTSLFAWRSASPATAALTPRSLSTPTRATIPCVEFAPSAAPAGAAWGRGGSKWRGSPARGRFARNGAPQKRGDLVHSGTARSRRQKLAPQHPDQTAVLDLGAAVAHHLSAWRRRASSAASGDHPELQPNAVGAHGDGPVHHRHHLRRLAEHVDEVDLPRHVRLG